MFDSMSVLLLIFLLIVAFAFIAIAFFLSWQLRQARQRLNELLEEKGQAQEEADRYAKIAQNPLGPLFAQNADPLILSFDAHGKITKLNDTVLQKFGYTKTQLIGKNITGTILPKQAKETDDIVYRLFKNPTLFIDAETETQTRNGDKIWISWTNKVNYNAKGKPISVDAVGFDITKRKNMEAELQYLSSIDPQTGVLNRPALLQTGMTELKRAKRYHRALSVVALKFQTSEANQTLTDAELKEVTNLVRKVVRSVDYFGRIGDTEFSLILPETSKENVPFLIQRLSQFLDYYNKKNKHTIQILYAATEYSKESDTIDNLLSQALRKVNQPNKRGLS